MTDDLPDDVVLVRPSVTPSSGKYHTTRCFKISDSHIEKAARMGTSLADRRVFVLRRHRGVEPRRESREFGTRPAKARWGG